MNKLPRFLRPARLGSFVCILLTLLTACRQSDTTPIQITVFAASSLTDAFENIATAFEADQDVDVLLNFGGSSSLATQIIEGAQTQIFASANPQQMERITELGLNSSSPRIFASNVLVAVIPASNPADIETLADIAKPGVKLIMAAPGVPIRDYTDAMLTQLEDDAVYGPDFKQTILDNLVSEEDNVRQVIAKVVLGEADAAFVYQSDITPDIADDVRVIAIPEGYAQSIAYPIAVIQTTDDTRLITEIFIQFIFSEKGQQIIADAGFIPVCTTDCPK